MVADRVVSVGEKKNERKVIERGGSGWRKEWEGLQRLPRGGRRLQPKNKEKN